jgi:hypothetical protein
VESERIEQSRLRGAHGRRGRCLLSERRRLEADVEERAPLLLLRGTDGPCGAGENQERKSAGEGRSESTARPERAR